MKRIIFRNLYLAAIIVVFIFVGELLKIAVAKNKLQTLPKWSEACIQIKTEKPKVVNYNNINHMVCDLSLTIGDTVSTKGYYSPNDGGNGTYFVRNKTVNDADNGGSIVFLNNGKVAELITDETVNVKQFGAKGNSITDDTEAFRRMFSSDYRRYYIPKGEYSVNKQICNYKTAPLTHDIEIFGDGRNLTKLKLQDRVIDGDGQRLFTIMAAENTAISVCLHDLHIDMNRTNNHTVVDSSGDRYALQHCHAIGIYPAENAPATVVAYNLSFYDLIGDGLGLSGNETKSYDRVTVHHVISKGRQGTRSDICLTGDFNYVSVTDCDLDSLETEVNHPTVGRKREFVAHNVVTRQRLDFGAKKDITEGNRWNYKISNVEGHDLHNLRYCKCTYSNCKIYLGRKFGVADADAYFTACEIGVEDTYAFKENQRGLLTATYKQNSSLHFKDCKIRLSGTMPFIYKESPRLISAHDIYDLSFDSCNIDASDLKADICLVRAGDVKLKNNRVKINDHHFVRFGSLLSDITCTLTGNIVKGNGSLLKTPPGSKNNSKLSVVTQDTQK